MVQNSKPDTLLDVNKTGATSARAADDWQLAAGQAVLDGVTEQGPAPEEATAQARAFGGAHLRLARNVPLLQSQEILGTLMREVNSMQDSLLTARSGERACILRQHSSKEDAVLLGPSAMVPLCNHPDEPQYRVAIIQLGG